MECQQSKQTLQDLTNELQAKNHQLSVAAQNINELTIKAQKCDVTINEYNQKLESTARELTNLQEQLTLNQRHCADKDQQIQSLSDLRSQYENEKRMITLQCNQKDAKIQELVGTLNMVKGQKCTECEAKYQQLQHVHNQLGETCSQKDKDVLMLQQKVDNMDIECSRVNSEINIWRAEYEKMKNGSMIIEQQCTAKDQRINELQGQIRLVTQQKDQEANHRINILEQQINNYKIQYEHYEQQCNAKSQQMDALQQQVIQAKNEVSIV